MNFLKNFLKRNKTLYLISLTSITLLRLFLERAAAYPYAAGWSRFDFIPNRKRLRELKEAYHPQKPADSTPLFEALEQDWAHVAEISEREGRVMPLSFSWPGRALSPPVKDWESREHFSDVVPGEPYSYTNYSSYLRQYRESKFALTIKKGGWDCFRHLEIFAAGSIPIMPDIGNCPEWAMAWYPKAAMSAVASQVQNNMRIDPAFVNALQEFFAANLSAKSMARRILIKMGQPEGRVVFLDPHLNSRPEYLSVMTYVGLKQSLGKDRVVAPFGAGPIFRDWTGDGRELHGLGFGYTKILSASMRSASEGAILADQLAEVEISNKDIVIVGSLSRNEHLADQVNDLRLPEGQVIYLWGDDRSPNRQDLRWIRGLRGYLAFRELDDGRKAVSYLEEQNDNRA